MLNPDFTILYVDSPARSARFYEELLGIAPVESSATFVMFITSTGSKLGFWSRHTVEPKATSVGGCELVFAVRDEQAVDQLHQQWLEKGVTVIQSPQHMDFGYTFAAMDMDGHRLRVYGNPSA